MLSTFFCMFLYFHRYFLYFSVFICILACIFFVFYLYFLYLSLYSAIYDRTSKWQASVSMNGLCLLCLPGLSSSCHQHQYCQKLSFNSAASILLKIIVFSNNINENYHLQHQMHFLRLKINQKIKKRPKFQFKSQF